MKKIYLLFIVAISMLFATQAIAQRYVPIAASGTADPTDIYPIIKGDTTATGERVDNNTIYQLENGQVYVTSGRMVNTTDWPLQIEALDLENKASKAILTRKPNDSGSYKDIMRAGGDVSLKNLWIISGEKGPLEQHDWGKIRIMTENSKVVIKDCIIEKDRGGFIQIRANGIKAYLTNTILRNGGNRRIIQGNGRGFECRNYTMDTVIMKNCIVHNIQDRFFRSQGASEPHNYIEIDHCTSYNTAGRHGFIQLGRVVTAKITNNLFINPIMLGTSPIYTNEQTQPDNDKHKVITLDTLYSNTSLTVANNNIFWTQDVMDYWATNDSVSTPDILSDLIIQNLGSNASDAYFQDTLTLSSVPGSILQYVKDLYADPAAEDMYDFIVEDIAVQGTAFDSGNLFDFSTFNPCYPTSKMSATGGTDGSAVGATFLCADLMTANDNISFGQLNFDIFPNPTSNELNFSFELNTPSNITIYISGIDGRKIQLENANFSTGVHSFSKNITNNFAPGMYFLTIQSKNKIESRKVIIH